MTKFNRSLIMAAPLALALVACDTGTTEGEATDAEENAEETMEAAEGEAMEAGTEGEAAAEGAEGAAEEAAAEGEEAAEEGKSAIEEAAEGKANELLDKAEKKAEEKAVEAIEGL